MTTSKQLIYIFVNGVLNSPGDAHAWTDRACAWVNARTPDKGEKFEYFAGVLTRRLKQSQHAQDLAEDIEQFLNEREELVLVGHSNGCDLILRALKLVHPDALYEGSLRAIHLISAACDSDMEKNGLNDLFFHGLLDRLTIYIAGRDSHFCHPMWFARQSQKLVGWLGLGYGTMGAFGPLLRTCKPSADFRTRIITEPDYDHSTWFRDSMFNSPFQKLMREITNS